MPAMPMPAVEPVLAPGIKTTSNGHPTAATPTVVHVEAQSMGTSHIQGLTFAKHPGHPADSHQKTAFAKKGKHGKSRTRQDKKVARPGVTSLT